jgi:hypothetical protein
VEANCRDKRHITPENVHMRNRLKKVMKTQLYWKYIGETIQIGTAKGKLPVCLSIVLKRYVSMGD